MSGHSERSGNPYAPLAGESMMGAAGERRTVTFAASDRLPKICLRCGTKQGVKRRPLRLGWVHPATYLVLLLLPLGLLPYLIIISMIKREASAELPFCDPCNAVWSSTTLVRGGLIVAGLVSAIVTLTVGFNGTLLAGGVLALISTTAVTIAWRRFLPPTRLRLRRIDPGSILIFDGVHSAAMEAIEAMYAPDRR